MPSSVKISTACRMVSQSDLLPITTPTTGVRGTSGVMTTATSPSNSCAPIGIRADRPGRRLAALTRRPLPDRHQFSDQPRGHLVAVIVARVEGYLAERWMDGGELGMIDSE